MPTSLFTENLVLSLLKIYRAVRCSQLSSQGFTTTIELGGLERWVKILGAQAQGRNGLRAGTPPQLRS